MNTNSIGYFCNNKNNFISYKSEKTLNNKHRNTTVNTEKSIFNKKNALIGLGVVATIGMVFAFRNKIGNFCSELFQGLSKPKKGNHKPKIVQFSYSNNGPKIDFSNGETAISDAWNSYIDEVESRINSHKDYARIFTTKANQEILNRFAKVA